MSALALQLQVPILYVCETLFVFRVSDALVLRQFPDCGYETDHSWLSILTLLHVIEQVTF